MRCVHPRHSARGTHSPVARALGDVRCLAHSTSPYRCTRGCGPCRQWACRRLFNHIPGGHVGSCCGDRGGGAILQPVASGPLQLSISSDALWLVAAMCRVLAAANGKGGLCMCHGMVCGLGRFYVSACRLRLGASGHAVAGRCPVPWPQPK